jgi:hypothetical protein
MPEIRKPRNELRGMFIDQFDHRAQQYAEILGKGFTE